MKKLILLVTLFVGFQSFSQTDSQKHQRAKIFYNNPEQLKQLKAVGLPFDHGIHKRGVFFESDFSETEIQQIQTLGFRVEIIFDNVRDYYLNQNNPNHKDFVSSQQLRNVTCTTDGNTTYSTPVNFNVFPANQFGGFYTYSQVLQELDDMVTLYPNLITAPANIGSFLTQGLPDNATTPSIGSNPIKWLKISDNPNVDENEPEILYTAIHHAREPASLSQLIFYMWYLLENYDSDPEIQNIINNTELYFVPVINPDGYLYNEKIEPQGGGFWRKNRRNGHGVDNNRNYDYYINGNSNNGIWGGAGSSSDSSSEIYHGTGPFSEVENQAMKWFVEQHDFKIALNNHTFGQLVYFPFGYADVATPEEALFQNMTSELVSQNGYNNLRDFPFSGDSDDFMYGTVGTHSSIYAMTPEIGTSFWPAQSTIESICKNMMYFNITAAHMVSNFAIANNTSDIFITNTSDNANYSLKRLGLENPGNFTVNINPISSNIISVGTANAHNGLTYGQVVDGNISLTLDESINSGDLVEYEIIVNNGVFDRAVSVRRIFGLPIIALNDPADNTANWATSDWFTTTEDFVSAPSSITDSPNTNYSDNANEVITLSNEIDLSGALEAYLTFNAKWEIETNWDYVQVEVSLNNGSSWIPQCGNYTSIGGPNQNAATNEPIYEGVQNTWIQETIDLSDYLDQTILIRFRLVSDTFVTLDGFYFDDLKVNVLENNLSTNEFVLNNFKLYPNPVSYTLNIVSNIQNYEIKVFNIQGQQVFTSLKNTQNSYLNFSNFASGIYLLKINTAKGSETFKIVKE